jgi:acyl-CoA thioesterase FadM
MDDLMSNHLFQRGIYAVTAEISLRFRKPVPLDHELLFTSRVETARGSVWTLTCNCATAAEPEVALSNATGRFVEVPRQ